MRSLVSHRVSVSHMFHLILFTYLDLRIKYDTAEYLTAAVNDWMMLKL